MKHLKRAVVWLLCVALTTSWLPLSAFAENESSSEYSISNGYITYTFNKDTGGFSIDTAEGHPEKYYDNNIPLLYKEDKERSNGTSFISVRINDKDYIFGQDYSFFKINSNLKDPVISEEGRLITIEWTIKDITVIKKIALSTDADSDLTGNAGISFEVINNSGSEADIGIRLLLDTALGSEVDSPYVVVDQDITPTYVESEFSGDKVPAQIRNVDSLSNPRAMSYLIAKGWSAGIEPTKIIVGHWANIANTKYDYTVDKYCDFTNYSNKYGTPDSAAAVYWEQSGLAAGSSFTAEALYGVGNFSEDTDDLVGLDMSVTRVELNDEGTGYENDGLVDITLTIDNALDDSTQITAALIRLSYDEEDYTTVDGYPTQTGYDVLEKGETRTVSFRLQAKPQAQITAGEIYVALTGTNAETQDTIETMTERSIILPSVSGVLPDIQLTSVRPGTVYYKGTKAVTITGDMKEFDTLSVSNGGWDLRLYHTTTDHSVLIEKKNISFLDDEYTAMSFSTTEDLALGEYEIVFEFTDELLVAAFGKSIKVDETLLVSDNDYYALKCYGIVALVRTTDDTAGKTDYDFFTFESEAEYQEFYNGEKEMTGKINGTTIQFEFGGDLESIIENEILVTVRGEFREMERLVTDDEGNELTEVYWQANKEDGDIIINNILSYEGDSPLEMYKGTTNNYVVEGDGLLKVVNSINVWRSEWSIQTRENIVYSLDVARATVAANNVYQLELALEGAGTMVQSLGGFLIDLYYGVLNSTWWDDGDGRVTYGIGFGGMVAIPIKGDETKGKISGQGGTARSTGLTDGQVTAEITSVMFGEDAELVDHVVVVDDVGYQGINTTVSLGIPQNMFGSMLSNGVGVAVTMTINTIDNIYEFDMGISVKLIECEAIIGFKEASVDGKAMVLPDRLEFYIRNGISIPLGPLGPPAYITGIGGGIQNLADTIGGNYIDKLPPITVVAAMRLRVIKLLVGDLTARVSLSGLEITGQLTINEKKEILDLNAGLSATWLTPWSVKLYGNISVLGGIIQGGLTVTIADDYFYGYIYAAIYVPDAIPIVGGRKLAGVEAAACTEFIGANVEIIGFKFGVIYYWGSDDGVKFADNVDLSPPVQEALLSIQSSDEVYTAGADGSDAAAYYGTNVHRLQTSGQSIQAAALSLLSVEDGYDVVNTTVGDVENQDNLLFSIPYTGSTEPTAEDLVLVAPDDTQITMVEDDNEGGGNFFTREEADGITYIYISVTDKSLLKSGTWTLRYANDIGMTPGAITVSGVDDLSSATGVSLDYDSNDPFELSTSWTISGDCEDAMSLDIYLTTDKNIAEEIKTSDNTEYGLGDNIFHTEDVTEIQSGAAAAEIPESYMNGTYYAVAMLTTMSGASVVTSAESFDFTNPNLPMDVAGVTASYGGDGNLYVEIEDPDNADYTDYMVEVVSEDGTYLTNNLNQYDIDDDEIYIGKEANLTPNQRYYVNVRTVREETTIPDAGSEDSKSTSYYYGGNVVSSNSVEIPELQKPELVSVEASFDTSEEYISDKDITLTYTFAEPVSFEFNLRGERITYTDEPKTVWEVELTDLNDGDYYTDFTATAESKDTATGADFEDAIPDARIGFTIDSSDPILSLSKRSAESLDESGVAASSAANVVFTDEDGNYTINGITEVSAAITVDGSTENITVNSDGSFEYAGTLASDETDKQHVIKAVDKAGNTSEQLVYVVNSNMGAIDRIVLVANGKELEATKDAEGNTQDPIILLDGDDEIELIVRAYQADGSYVDIPGEDVEWEVLYEKNLITLDNGTVKAVYGGTTAVKAKLPTAVITTADGNEITAGLEAYTVISISEVFTGYILSYNLNGGYSGPASVTGLDACEYTLSTTVPLHADSDSGTPIVFIGWSAEKSDTIYSKTEQLPELLTTVSITDNTTVYAVWGYDTDGDGTADATEPTYTLTYDANGGTGAPEAETGLLSGEYTLNTETVPTYYSEDTPIVFIGWSETQDSTVYSMSDELPTVVAGVNVSEDTTVYAVWGYDTDSNGIADIIEGAWRITYTTENITADKEIEYVVKGRGLEVTITANSGYTMESVTVIMGGEDITDEVYDAKTGAIVIPSVTADVEITAKAELTRYTVVYDANGGHDAPDAETGLLAGVHILSETAPVHDDDNDTQVVFIGWSTVKYDNILSKTDSAPDVAASISLSADTTVYAVWGYDENANGTADVSESTYTLTYDANGGTGEPAAETGLLADDYTLSSIAPTHDAENGVDIVFIGWSTEKDGTIYEMTDSIPDVVEIVSISASTTVYAVWGYDTDSNGIADVVDGAHKIIYTFTHVTADNEAEYVVNGKEYETTVKAKDGYTIEGVTVTMGGVDVTDEVYDAETGEIVIPSVTADVEITASARLTRYTVAYDANGGQDAPEADTGLLAGEHTLSTAAPTHDDDGDTKVAFIGWSMEKHESIYSRTDTVPEIVTEITVSADTTVYAVWGYDTNGNGTADAVEGAFTLTYDANGGSGEPEAVTGLLTGAYTLDTDTVPTHDDTDGVSVVFIGWSEARDSKIYSMSDTIPTVVASVNISADTTVYAVWGLDTDSNGVADVIEGARKISFSLDNITADNETEYVIDGGSYELTLVANEGYTIESVTVMMGGADITDEVYDAQTGKISIPEVTGDIEITASTEVIRYTVTYDANGGSGTMTDDNSPYAYGSTVTALANGFSRTSYTFSGWNTAADGSGTSYKANATFTITEDTTLYAQWTRTSTGSGGGGGGGTSTYTVTFNSNGGSSVSSVSVAKGSSVSAPTEPTRSGYTFGGWYSDSLLTEEYDFSSSVTKSITLYAKWISETDTDTPPSSAAPTDEPQTSAGADVSQMLNTSDHNAYMQGYGENDFAPDSNMTRAEAAMMFYRLLLNNNVTITKTFGDVPDGAWYAEAVNTLASLGIIEGYDDGDFLPDNSITRAEFTVIATRFADIDAGGENIFTDVNADDWFYDYVIGAAGSGWIGGYSDGTFMPNKTITRAEVVTIVNRMLGRIADKDYIDANTDSLVMFDDVDSSHWAYYDVAEAANGHEYTMSEDSEIWNAEN